MLKFGNTYKTALQVSAPADIKSKLEELRKTDVRYVRLSAARAQEAEESLILRGIRPKTEPVAPVLPEEYGLTEDNPGNFFAHGKIPKSYYLAGIDIRLCKEAARSRYLNALSKHEIVDIGSGGDGFSKGKIFLHRSNGQPTIYIPTDLDDGMLNQASKDFLKDPNFEHIKVATIEGKFEDTLPLLPPNDDRLYLFLGGTLGNLTPKQRSQFVNDLNASARPGALLLVTYSRAPEKGHANQHVANAYRSQDSKLMALHYIRNIVNPLLEKGFDLTQWEYNAVYNEKDKIVQRGLWCKSPQMIEFKDGTHRTFQTGEMIKLGHTKQFTPEDVAATFSEFSPVHNWTDRRQYVGLMLLEKK